MKREVSECTRQLPGHIKIWKDCVSATKARLHPAAVRPRKTFGKPRKWDSNIQYASSEHAVPAAAVAPGILWNPRAPAHIVERI